ncbi:hypothetical protein BOTBODRAFT_194833 [Botryobasidium botryosum FD-172 SS1]|uniref:Transcription factor domain-containing protein n=1 Tax=Botryobasidium botryosum (strain FD-172 SS1) TaxID=930990 RepID=A0A067N2J3_BOTB1|nr:hypothetical protein BOTBODRAFT_194833 [Botryobasidium botryosum FD-172 SS1]
MREATLSCSVTVGFAQSCGLHLIAPPLWGAETSSKLGGPVRTWLELGRRIKVWWTIFPLSRWASTFTRSGRPSTREDDDQIKTVWHLPQECYEEGRVPEDDFNSVSSLYALESGAALVSQDSPETIRSKIVILLERATTLGERAPEETNNCDPSDPFWLDFYCTDNALAAFIWSLPPLQRETQGLIGPDVSPTELVPELTFGHVMAYGAVIQLHNPLAKAGHDESRQKCFQAARGVMRVARLILAFKHTMSVVLSVTWFVAFQVYSRELNKVTEEARNPPMISYRDSSAPGAGDLISDMTVLLTLMRRLAEIYPVVCMSLLPPCVLPGKPPLNPSCPRIAPQVTELQEWYDKHCKIDARYSLS